MRLLALWQINLMALKKKKRPLSPPQAPSEPQAAEAATVAWMLSVMTTFACSIVAGILWLLVHDQGPESSTMLFVWFLHFSSVVTALISLALAVVVLKMRRTHPPLGITIAALLIAALPLLVALL